MQGTINGLGERCGNVDLCSVTANLALKYPGYSVLLPGQLEHLTEVSRYVYETANMNFRPGQPFVGTSAFAHKGGMHVHGVRKNATSYEHIDPATVGNERRVLVSELSGKSNIAEKLSEYGLEQDGALLSRSSTRSRTWRMRATSSRPPRRRSSSWSSGWPADTTRPSTCWAIMSASAASSVESPTSTEATIKLRVNDSIEHTVSEGDGPVNALDGALRKALEGHFPALKEMHLVDYKVRVINARAGTAARVRVVIESKDNDDVWGTVGVSENVIEASWLALADAFEYKLSKDARAWMSAKRRLVEPRA